MSKALVADLKKRMEGAITSLHSDMKGLRTGRANSSLLDRITIEVYGSKMPLNQVATINVPESRMITVQVWDKSNVQAVEKAIASSGLGLNPVTDGGLVRVPIPDLSEERRKELAKVAHQYAERAKVAIRNVRRDGMDSLKKMEKDKLISEDEHRNNSDEIQKITDNFIVQIDEILSHKEKDIISG